MKQISEQLNAFTTLECNENHLHIAFNQPQRVLSSSVLNGGLTFADHILNRKVENSSDDGLPAAQSLQHYADKQGWCGTTIGMMTAATMKSMRVKQLVIDDVSLAIVVTCGLSNARRAGDIAEVQSVYGYTEAVGTINLIVLCSASLSPAAMVEASMIATEAKVAALQQLQYKSAISDGLATGTGTDAIAIVCADNGPVIDYCGKHMLLGEKIGQLVIAAITSSVKRSSE